MVAHGTGYQKIASSGWIHSLLFLSSFLHFCNMYLFSYFRNFARRKDYGQAWELWSFLLFFYCTLFLFLLFIVNARYTVCLRQFHDCVE